MQKEEDVRAFFALLRDQAHMVAQGAMFFNTSYWFAWEISADAEPVLCKKLLKEIR